MPGGFVDYFLISANEDRRVQGFVALEIQTLDTTVSVWNARAQLLQELGVENTGKNYTHSSLWYKLEDVGQNHFDAAPP